MKNKIGLLVIGLVIASMTCTILPTKIVQAAGDFPCEAGGPYSGIAEVISGGKVLPVYFEGSYISPYGKLALNWSFDDGTYSNQQNPVHEYNSPGTYNVNFSVKVPPYHAWDTTTATIYTNNWSLSCDLIANKVLVYQGQDIKFRFNVMSAAGQYQNSPPFEMVLEIWNSSGKLTEIYRHYCSPLSPGGETGYHDYTWPANYNPGWYYCLGKVVFPNGLEYELCNSDTWTFRIWQL